MGYDRTYTLSEVARILDASEHRQRPDMPAGTGKKGHSISMHTTERKDATSRPAGERLPKKDSIFVISRNSLVGIVHEVLNSPSGQLALGKLNDVNEQSVPIKSFILRQGDFDIFTVYRPKEQGSQTSFDWLSTTKGDGYIVLVLVLVVKIPGSATEEIHIQTTHPRRWRRLQWGRS